ncbi:MAG: DUF5104 domain-containing protein, partial [Firmicutes bacterium]|nr:DUF5104 domain-containing protein [Bacillota bacterium]
MRKYFILICALILLTGCSNVFTYDREAEGPAKKIVQAFDDRDAELLKSVLREDCANVQGIDESIQKAFDLYKGKSVEYSNLGLSSRDIDDHKIKSEKSGLISVKTDAGIEYNIQYFIITRDDWDRKNEGMYAVHIIPQKAIEEAAAYCDEYDIYYEPAEMPDIMYLQPNERGISSATKEEIM